MKKEVYLLIDSHALIHRAYHALPYLQTKDGRPSGALYGLITILLGAIERFKPDHIYAANDLPKTTFREMAYNGYKAHRTKTEDFLVEQIIAMPELFNSFGIPLLSLEGYEADDVIGTLVKKIQIEKLKEKKVYQIVILTGDMDIMQLIDDDKVVVYTAKKGEEEIIYHEQEVMKKYGLLPKQIPDYKGLRGDTSDNIPGIKGIGEKTALTILQKGGTLNEVYELIKSGKDKDYFGITERMFELLKNGEEDAEFSRELATINCDIEIDIPTDGKFILQEKINNLKNYCEDFGFASIKKRLEKLEGKEKPVELNDFAEVGGLTPNPSPLERGASASTNYNFSSSDFKKIQILFWLLNSQETNIDEARMNYLLQKMPQPQKENIIQYLEQEVVKKDLDFVYREIELPLIPILEEANVAGIKVDREKLKTLLQIYEKNRAELEEKIYSLAGKTFNLNSPKQLGVILFEELKVQDVGSTKIKKTAGGKLSTRFEVLEEMKDNHPIIPLLLDFREKEKMINTYLEPLLVYSQFDEKIHTTFIQTGAQTGRFSSLNPNMQNIPVKGEEGVELRKCFIADEGKVLIAADYSQIELRIAAMLSGEEYLKEVFEKDEDIHASVASKMFKKDKQDISKEERNAAKAMNFGILYGMGVNSIKNTLKVERNVAQAFYDSYTFVMPALMKYLKDTIAKAKDVGYTETLYGRQRNIPELFSNIPMIRASGERFAMNAPIQGTNADIIKLAITDFKKVCVEKGWTDIYDKKTREKISPKVTFLLQIHDELIYKVDEEMVDEVSKELKKVMENVIEMHKPKNSFLPVPIKVNVKSGYNWGEM